MNLYVGNLSYETNADGLKEAFSRHGTVESVDVIADRQTGRSRGFAFVVMPNDDEARAAMQALDGSEVDGRQIQVNEARPQEPRRQRAAGY